MNRRILVLFLVLISIITVACTPGGSENARAKPVKVLEVQEETMEKTLDYIGVVEAEVFKKIAFKSGGRIKRVHVKKGESIEKGTVLVELDAQDLEFACDAAKAGMEAARAQLDKALKGARSEEVNNAALNVKKAQDAYDFALENFTKLDKLYGEGAISKLDLDKAKLELDVSQTELEQAKEVYSQVAGGTREEDKKMAYASWEQAKTDYEQKKKMLEDAVITSDLDGYVVDVLYDEGELVAAGYPVVVIRGEGQVVRVGISQKDMGSFGEGARAVLSADGIIETGQVTEISQVPDTRTRTYETEILLDGSRFEIGSVVKVKIVLGYETGIWIPITSVMNDGEDYVFVVEEDTIVRKGIRLGEIRESSVMVEGLNRGDKLVIENARQVRPGDGVTIIE
ncbi:MAG: putative Co/Zn/Cd efflux system membrane fusion protein [Firmicutes bacterium]|nr:putative Co/Zn/Cd efflux system membrane fusion protein [Bacillota bacterium]MDI6705164.1 biotin/lipoyl-binding protein [Bacillota bacterium]